MVSAIIKASVGIVVVLATVWLTETASHSVGHGRKAVFGFVTAAGGQAASNGWFVHVTRRGMLSFPMAITDKVGAFALDTSLSPGRYFFSTEKGGLSFKSPVRIGRRAGWYQVIELKGGLGLGAAPAVVKEKSGGTVVFGLVSKADGVTPLVGSIVGAMRSSSLRLVPPPETEGDTNSLGTFVLGTHLRPGTYFISASRGLSARFALSSSDIVARKTVVIKSSSGPWVVVRLLEASGSLTGRVFGRSGRPVGNAGVNLVGTTNRLMYATRTNRTGRYSIRGVIPDMYVVDVSSHAGHAEAAVKVGKGRATQNFTVPPSPW